MAQPNRVLLGPVWNWRFNSRAIKDSLHQNHRRFASLKAKPCARCTHILSTPFPSYDVDYANGWIGRRTTYRLRVASVDVLFSFVSRLCTGITIQICRIMLPTRVWPRSSLCHDQLWGLTNWSTIASDNNLKCEFCARNAPTLWRASKPLHFIVARDIQTICRGRAYYELRVSGPSVWKQQNTLHGLQFKCLSWAGRVFCL